MSEDPRPFDPEAPPKRRWLRRLGIAAGALLLLLVVAYFVVTSGGFVRSFIIPRVGQAINAKLTVGEASLSPFSGLELRQVRLETTGAEPLLQAESLRVRYDLMAILHGNIVVPEITLVGPTVSVVQQADGKSNLDPLLQLGSKKTTAPKPPKEKGPTLVDLGKITLSKGTLKWLKENKDGSRQSSAVTGLEIAVSGVKNGQTSKLTIAADVDQETQASPKATNVADVLRAKLSGTVDFTLDPNLLPSTVKGDVHFDVGQGQGAYKELTGLGVVLACDSTPTELRQASLRFSRGAQPLGHLDVRGPFDAAKSEAKLTLTVSDLDRNVLNLFGAPRGLDFLKTTVNTTNRIEITAMGALVAARGTWGVRQFSIKQGDMTTPSVDMSLSYECAVNLTEKTAAIQKLILAGTQGGRPVLSAVLDRPMNVAWNGKSQGLNEAAVSLAITNLDLRDWQLFMGPAKPEGTFSAKGTISSKMDGQRLAYDLAAQLKDLAVTAGSNRVGQLQINLACKGQFNDFRSALLDNYSLEVGQGGSSLAKLNGSGTFDATTKDANIQVGAAADLPNLLKIWPQPQLKLTSGQLVANGLITGEKGKLTSNLNVALKKLTGRCASYDLSDWQLSFASTLDLQDQKLRISRAALDVSQGNASGGKLELSGTIDLTNPTNKTGQFEFNVQNLNQVAIGPFAASALAPNTLTSSTLNLKGTAHFDPAAETAVQATLDLSNVLLTDPSHKLPTKPFAAQLRVDFAQNQGLFDIRQCVLSLTPHTAGTNEITLSGKLNLTNQVGDFSFAINELNESGLAPWLAPALAPRTLTSISITSKGTAHYDPQGTGKVQFDLELARLLVKDPDSTAPPSPIGAKFRLDIAQQQSRLDINKCVLTLPPNQRATNEIQATGKMDLAKTNARPTELHLTADSLDLTTLYDLFTTNATKKANGKAAAGNQPVTATVANAGEPDPISLPWQEFTADLKIGRLYLRQMVISNWTAGAAVKKGQVTLKPFQLSLNGAPVDASASADLTQPGYVYSLSLRTDKLALGPITDTFNPDKKGQFAGDLYANAQVKGAGVTGTNLQKNLQGTVGFNLTNMNLQVVGPKLKGILTPISLLLQAPELLETPLNVIAGDASITNGVIILNHLVTTSQAFVANAQGDMKIAAVLTNSPLHIPLQLALRRNLATRARLVSANASTNGDYVPLPQFATVGGTMGNPKTQIDKAKLGGQLLDTAGQLIGGEKGNLLQGVGELFKGGNPLAPSTTNAPPTTTNAPTKVSPLDLLRSVLPPKQ